MFRRLVLALACLTATPVTAAPVVLAAASLQETMTAAADAWAARGRARPKLAFASTATLAKQIQSGAAADVFVSADETWAAVLDRAGLVRPGTRATFLGNRLVLAVPRADPRRLRRLRDLPGFLRDGRLAIAEPEGVPAGRYAKAALEVVGVWPVLERRVVRAENVRAALKLVARGTAAAGMVYATDVAVEPGVRVAGVVPLGLTPPIRYVIAIPAASRDPDAAAFRAFLLSRDGRRIFTRAGFLPPR